MGKLEVEVEVKAPAEEMWCSIRDSADIFPKVLPEYKSIEILEGDGKSAGSIRLIKYSEGTPGITFSKEQILEADEEKKKLSYIVIDSDLEHDYKSFKAFVEVCSKADGGLVKWSAEYEKASEDVPDPKPLQDFAVKTLHDLDAYLIKA